MSDVIDTLAGIAPGSPLDAIRDRRRQARDARAGELRLAVRAGDARPMRPSSSASPSPASSPACTAGRRSRPSMARRWPQPARGRAATGAIDAADRGGQGAGALRRTIPKGPLSAEDTAGPVYRVGAAERERARAAARRGIRARAHAGVPPARCRAALAAGAARCRLVDHGHRDAVAARRLPVLPDPGRRRLARPRRQDARLRMTDKVLSTAAACRARRLHPRHARLAALARADGAEQELTAAPHGGPGRCGARQVAVFPAAGARSRRARGAHAHRQGHLLQSRGRPAARRARARRRRDLALQRLHLLRLGACPLRRDLFQARGRRRPACWTRASAPISTSAGTRSSRPRWR